MRLCYRVFQLAIERAFYRSLGVVERGEIDSVPFSNGFYLLYALRSDEASSLREGLEATLQCEGHAFEETSMHYVGEGMPI